MQNHSEPEWARSKAETPVQDPSKIVCCDVRWQHKTALANVKGLVFSVIAFDSLRRLRCRPLQRPGSTGRLLGMEVVPVSWLP